MTYITYTATSRFWISAAHSLRWSALRQIGNLPLMRAVMFAPVIAYLILFNDYVLEFVNSISVNVGLPQGEEIQLANIYLLYYGLTLVGLGSIVYSLACPNSAARFADRLAFAREVQATGASSIVLSYFDDVLEKFLKNREDGNEEESSSYPERVRFQTSQMVIEIFKSYLKSEAKARSDSELESDDDSAQFLSNFITGSGYYNAEAIAESVYQAPKVIWAFTEPYRAIAVKEFAADIGVAKYEIDDHSRVVLRLLTACFYVVGFTFLFIPSVRSFVAISIAVFSMLW